MLKNTDKSTNKLILLSIAIIGILLTVVGLLYSSFALIEPVKSISFSSTNLNYSEKEPGSWKVEKSAEWVSQGKARITFNVDTVEKIKDNTSDVFLLLDASSSMQGEKIENIKTSIIDFADTFLSNTNNNLSIISFNDKAQIISELTNEKSTIESSIHNIQTENERNFYSAFLKLEELLNEYTFTEDRNCIILLVTNGISTVKVEKSYYQYLKLKYKNIDIKAIQYEQGETVVDSLKTISDEQYIASEENIVNTLKKSIDIIEAYDNFILTDYIDTTSFYVKTENDIKTNQGTTVLDQEKQKITWTIDSLKTGDKVTLTIDIYQKKGNTEKLISTNKEERVESSISSVIENVTSTKTPILKTEYNVTYDNNVPSLCTIESIPTKSYQVFSSVEIEEPLLACEGYQFKGWKIITENVKRINKDYFIMPENDVTLIAEWSSLGISKTMDGAVQEYQQPYLQSVTKNYSEEMWKYKADITKVVFQDQIKSISGSIESWDLSETNNYGVVGYLVPNVDNTTYTVYIQGENEIIANTDSSYLFDGMTSLESIEGLEYLNTTNVENMGDMFRNCASLIELDLSGWNTSRVTNMNSMFRECGLLTSLNISSFETNNVTDFSLMFFRCRSIESLDLNHFKTLNSTNIEYMFSGCDVLKELNILNFDTSNVKYMAGLFNGCSQLLELDVSHFNTRKVVDMQEMFVGCSSLTTLDVSKFDTANNRKFNDMFNGCSGLTNLDVSNFNTSSAIDMGQMFSSCSSLVNLDVQNFNTQNVTSMYAMFRNCSSLTNLNLTNFITTNVTTMADMFRECKALETLDISNFDTVNVTSMDSMFRVCSNLQSLNIGNFNTSKVTNMRYMFYECKNLSSLDVSNFDTSNVKYMQSMFRHCNNLQNLNLENFNTSNVTSMEAMFNGCSSLTSLNLENFNTSNVTNMEAMFNGCSSLTSLNLENFDTSNITSMDSMFRECKSLETLNISTFDTSKVINMYCLFYRCEKLRELNISNFDTSLVTNMQNMFYGCTSLINLDISSFNTSNVINMRCMFYRCENLENLNLGVFDTSKVENMFSLFTYDRKLTATITISSSNITDYADIFYGTSSTMGQVTVNYTTETEALVDAMISSKSSDANVVKGVLVTS